MLNLSTEPRIWLCTQATDMRKSFDGLSAMVKSVMKQNPISGDWFVFVNRRRTMMKILFFAPGGYCLWAKRLEQCTFSQLSSGQLTLTELMLLIDGIDVKQSIKRRRYTR